MLWTTAKLAKVTGLTPRHIARLVKGGSLKGQKVGHDWIIADEDAQEFIAQRKQLTEAKPEE